MSGESGEGIPLPIHPKAEADINEALTNAKAETLPKPPGSPAPEAPPPPAERKQDEWAAFRDAHGPQDTRGLTQDSRIPGWLTNMKKRDPDNYWRPQTEAEDVEPDSSAERSTYQDPLPAPEKKKQDEWAAYKAALVPKEWLASTIQNPPAAPEQKPLDARSRRDLLRGKSPKSR
jgi:hypothetical protein